MLDLMEIALKRYQKEKDTSNTNSSNSNRYRYRARCIDASYGYRRLDGSMSQTSRTASIASFNTGMYQSLYVSINSICL
jgi:hypothetical protein